MTQPFISVIVPVLNESGNINTLIDEIASALTPLGIFEIVYVDDGSTDDTADLLATLSQQREYLSVVAHVSCCGQSTAIQSGVLAAKAEWIATIDGDGQNDPADIVKLWKSLQDYPADVRCKYVMAGHRHQRKDTWVKRWSSKFANFIRSRILRDSTPDTGCGLKIFSREGFLKLPYFDHMHRFLPALFIRQGYLVTSVHVDHRNRQTGISNYGTFDRLAVGIPDLLGVFWLNRRYQSPVFKENEEG